MFVVKSLDEHGNPLRVLKKYKHLTKKEVMFHQEREALRDLNLEDNNPPFLGVVKLYDLSQKELFLVLEHVDGKDLEKIVGCRGEGRFGLLETLSMVTPLAKILSVMLDHYQIVHGDLKAANILLDKSATSSLELGNSVKIDDFSRPDAIKLCDFTYSLRNGASPFHDLTEPGFFVGTLRYCSPEIVQGARRGQASDVWALGVIVTDMISAGGALPGIKTTRDAFFYIGNSMPTRIKNTREKNLFGFDDLVYSMCARKPSERPSFEEVYQSCLQIQRRVEENQAEQKPKFFQHNLF